MPLGGDGGVMLPQEDSGVMSLRGHGGVMPSSRGESARCQQRLCDVIVIMESWCEANKSCSVKLPQDGVVSGHVKASSMTRWFR
jgi:hypothetical protein